MTLKESLAPAIRADAARKFSRAVNSIGDSIDAQTPVKTGRLKRSRRTRLSLSGNRLSAEISYRVSPDYGEMLDKGTRAHVVRPRRAKVLRFVVNGRIVYARSARIPAIRKHKGWFSRQVTSARWRSALDRVFGR